MHWGHGSSYPGAKYVSHFDNKTDCQKGVKVVLKSSDVDLDYLPLDNSYSALTIKAEEDDVPLNSYIEINHFEGYYKTEDSVVLYLAVGEYDISKLGVSSTWKTKILTNEWTDENGDKITKLKIDGSKKEYTLTANVKDALKVTFNANGGKWGTSTSKTLYADKNGVIASAPNDPTWGEIPFGGWWYSNRVLATFPLTIRTDTNLYANWVGYDVDFYDDVYDPNYDGRTGFGVPNRISDCDLTVPEGSTIPSDWCIPTILKTNCLYGKYSKSCILTGWKNDPDGNGEFFDFSKPITRTTWLYAVWEPKCSVYFDLGDEYKEYYDGGFAPGDEEKYKTRNFACGKIFTDIPENPSLPGYIFQGWIDGNENPINWRLIKGDLNVYATWEPIPQSKDKYTITYNANGGSYAPLTTIYTENTDITLEYPRYAGHIFKGWSKTKGCPSGIGDSNYEKGTTIEEENLTLYACWKVEEEAEKCSLRSNPSTGDSTFRWLILFEIIAIGSLISYLVMKRRKNSNVS